MPNTQNASPESAATIGDNFPTDNEDTFIADAESQETLAQQLEDLAADLDDNAKITDENLEGVSGEASTLALGKSKEDLVAKAEEHRRIAEGLRTAGDNIATTKANINATDDQYHSEIANLEVQALAMGYTQEEINLAKTQLLEETQGSVSSQASNFESTQGLLSEALGSGQGLDESMIIAPLGAAAGIVGDFLSGFATSLGYGNSSGMSGMSGGMDGMDPYGMNGMSGMGGYGMGMDPYGMGGMPGTGMGGYGMGMGGGNIVSSLGYGLGNALSGAISNGFGSATAGGGGGLPGLLGGAGNVNPTNVQNLVDKVKQGGSATISYGPDGVETDFSLAADEGPSTTAEGSGGGVSGGEGNAESTDASDEPARQEGADVDSDTDSSEADTSADENTESEGSDEANAPEESENSTDDAAEGGGTENTDSADESAPAEADASVDEAPTATEAETAVSGDTGVDVQEESADAVDDTPVAGGETAQPSEETPAAATDGGTGFTIKGSAEVETSLSSVDTATAPTQQAPAHPAGMGGVPAAAAGMGAGQGAQFAPSSAAPTQAAPVQTPAQAPAQPGSATTAAPAQPGQAAQPAPTQSSQPTQSPSPSHGSSNTVNNAASGQSGNTYSADRPSGGSGSGAGAGSAGTGLSAAQTAAAFLATAPKKNVALANTTAAMTAESHFPSMWTRDSAVALFVRGTSYVQVYASQDEVSFIPLGAQVAEGIVLLEDLVDDDFVTEWYGGPVVAKLEAFAASELNTLGTLDEIVAISGDNVMDAATVEEILSTQRVKVETVGRNVRVQDEELGGVTFTANQLVDESDEIVTDPATAVIVLSTTGDDKAEYLTAFRNYLISELRTSLGSGDTESLAYILPKITQLDKMMEK